MKTTHEIEIDLLRTLGRYVSPIEVMQDDQYSRDIKITCTAGDAKPDFAGCTAQICFSKPDGTGGAYEALPDNTKAYAINGNTITVKLAPQVCTVPGDVRLAVALIAEKETLHTFAITLKVHKKPGLQATSENYFKIAGALADSGWSADMYLGTDAAGKVVEKPESFSKMKGIPEAASYGNLTANLDQGFYRIHREDWNDLPGGDNESLLALLVFWYTKYYYVHIAYSMSSNMVAYRIVKTDTHAVYKDWFVQPEYVVQYIDQQLTGEQREKARQNIGAASKVTEDYILAKLESSVVRTDRQQELSTAQMDMARNNINAASVDDVNNISNRIPKAKTYEHIATIALGEDDSKGKVTFNIDSNSNPFELTDFIIKATAGFVDGNTSTLYMNVDGAPVIVNGAIPSIDTNLRSFNIFFRQEADECRRVEYTASMTGDNIYNAQTAIAGSRLIPQMSGVGEPPITRIELFTMTGTTKEWVVGSTFELWGVRV